LKLRILDNSIRLRLTQSEVLLAAAGGPVRGTVSFGGGSRFDYLLSSGAQSAGVGASFSGHELTVTVPGDELRRWAESDAVSIEGSQPAAGAGDLRILVEKDFACLAPRAGEDESDMFPHPEAGKADC